MKRRVIAILAIIICSQLNAENEYFFSGFSYTGTYENINKNLPFTSNIIEDHKNEIAEIFYNGIKNKNIILGELAKTDGTTSQKALAISFDQENTIKEKINSSFKILCEVSAQILVFDFSTGQITETIPIKVRYIDTKSSEFSDNEIEEIYRKLILGGENITSFIEETREKLETLGNSFSIKKIQIVDIKNHSEKMSPNEIEALGSELTKELFLAIGKGVLPYDQGNTINGEMPAIFSNGESYNYQMPQADFQLNIEILKLVQSEISKSPNYDQFLFGAYIKMVLIEPISGYTIAEITVKNGKTKTVPTNSVINGRELYSELIVESFSRILSEKTRNENLSWIKAQDNLRNTRK